jgi:centromere protein C
MREIAGADFKFAKTLTLDFFGAGMVDLPPGVSKRIKNSRKMQMVFFVFYGRVTVNVGTPPTRFSIGKGGQFQVPRGTLFPLHCVFCGGSCLRNERYLPITTLYSQANNQFSRELLFNF